jgi:hypothetical protein
MVPTAFDSSSSPYQSSFTPSSLPPTGLSPSLQSFTSPSTTRQRRTILVTMGSCNWQGKNNGFRCPCTSGSCTSDLDASQASCDSCMHPMSTHSDYSMYLSCTFYKLRFVNQAAAFSPAVLKSASGYIQSRQITHLSK